MGSDKKFQTMTIEEFAALKGDRDDDTTIIIVDEDGKKRATFGTIGYSKVKQSVERLVHFQCGDCDKWWTIGDAPERSLWYCPWCGEPNSTVKK